MPDSGPIRIADGRMIEMSIPEESLRSFSIRRIRGETGQANEDRLAVEEPMEIRVVHGPEERREARSLSVTMRTPGNDFELAAGFLFTEQILDAPAQIRRIEFCGPAAPGRKTSNIVRVDLDPEVEIDLERMRRNFFTSSSCGICGKTSLDALQGPDPAPLDPDRPRIRAEVVRGLPATLRSAQPLFASTGGIHAAGRFDADGTLREVREDVGRHNAVDKLLGRGFLDGLTPLRDSVMVVSGRSSFEILQKALAAGVPAVVAVGAPSSLAVDLARRFGMTLIGFASPDRFNLYAGEQRMIGPGRQEPC